MHGGTRQGAGRKRLTDKVKLQASKIYLTPEQIKNIDTLGVGDTFSQRAVEVLLAELNRRTKADYTFIDLCAGIGGFRLGLESTGHFKCVLTSEINDFARAVYTENFGSTDLHGDLTELRYEDIPQHDILCAGFPCQPFSICGKQEGFEDTRGTLFFNIATIIREHRPRAVLLENVSNLVKHDGGRTYKRIMRVLKEDLHYTVYDSILNSKDFGVPQNRQRWYCVAFRDKVYYEFPKPHIVKPTLQAIVDTDLVDDTLALSDTEQWLIDAHFANGSKLVHHPDYPFTARDSKRSKQLVYSKLTGGRNLMFYTDFPIQNRVYCHLGGLSTTLVTSAEPKLYDLRRKLSAKECARLQGLPDEFDFSCVSAYATKKLCANAVTVSVIRDIGEEILNTFCRG